jgi:hypothetical protein
MNDEYIERLLGGYATNTLTEEERKELFEAALNDQALFDALQQEEPLRDLLSDRDSRQEIAEALKRPAKVEVGMPWWRQRWIWALSGAMAGGCVLVMVLSQWQAKQAGLPVVAMVKNQAPATPASPTANAIVPTRPEVEPAKKLVRRKVEMMAPEKAATVNGPIASPVSAAPPPSLADKKAELENTLKELSAAPQGQASPQAPMQTEGQLGRTRQGANAGLANTTIAPGAVALRGGFAMAKRASPRPRAVSVVRGDAVLGAADSVQSGDALRLRVTPSANGSLQLFQVDANTGRRALGDPFPVQGGQDVTIPSTPLAISQTETFLIVFTAADGSQQSTEVVLAPGKPPVVR